MVADITYQQLYYTSCEKGLTDYSGFQVKAATPGTSSEVMRRVESLTTYEPPRSLGHAPTAKQIASCPVNLCFLPGEEPVIAHVVFTGTDYSGRLGNYFAHALVCDHVPSLLPIQLWQADVWKNIEDERADLPAIRGPLTTGPLTRARIDEFLRDSGAMTFLPALLTAVDLAVHGGQRSVVILDQNTERVACWIAAVSYLLPPPTVREMSFATYQHRPRFSRQHVIGTVPDADFTAIDQAFETFYLFDFVGMNASDIPGEPLADHLAGDRAQGAASFWEQAQAMADGSERGLSSWYPVALAVDVLAGLPVPHSATGTLLKWLVSAGSRLSPGQVETLGQSVLALGKWSEEELLALTGVARAAGADALLAEAEIALVTQQIEAGGTTPYQVRTAQAHDHARRLILRHLFESDPVELANRLDLAPRCRVQIEPRSLRLLGHDVVGPWLLDCVEPDAVGKLLVDQPLIRRGALEFLASAPGDQLVKVFARGLRQKPVVRELTDHPRLAEAVALAGAIKSGRRPRVETLLAVADGVLSERLLRMFWQDRKWSLGDAVGVLQTAGRMRVPLTWLEPLINRVPRGNLESYARLCVLLTGSIEPDKEYSEPVRDRLAAMEWVLEWERRFLSTNRDQERRLVLDALMSGYEREGQAAREYLWLRLPRLLLAVPPRAAVEALCSGPKAVRADFVGAVDRMVARSDGEQAIRAAAGLFAVAWEARATLPKLAEMVEKRLLLELRGWRRKDLQRTGRAVDDFGEELAAEFDVWRSHHLRRRLLPVRRPVI